MQAVIDEEPWALALAAVEEELSATREELATLKVAAPEMDLRVTALETEVEELNVGYVLVHSGRNCKYITTTEECLEAAKALGYAATYAAAGSYLERPPGCRSYSTTINVVYLNTHPDANEECGVVVGGYKYPCLCKK